MALPVTIGSSPVTIPDQNYHCGPFKSPTTGAFYVVIKSSSTVIDAYKSTDPTSSFSIQDAASHPVSLAAVRSIWVYQDGDNLHIITSDATGTTGSDVEYHRFNMASGTDGWTSINNVIQAVGDTGDSRPIAASIGVRSDGDIVVLYQGESHKDMGADYSHIVFSVSTDSGSTWSTPVLVDADVAEVNYTGAVIIMDESDRTHFFWKDWDGSAGGIFHRSLDATDHGTAGGLNTATEIDATTTNDFYQYVNGLSYMDGATNMLAIAYLDASDILDVLTASTGDIPSWSTDEAVSDSAALTTSSYPAATMAVDGTDLYLLYSRGSDSDLYYDVDTGSGFGTDTEALDAVTINRVSANVYTRSGSTVIGYVYDDGGTVKYNEISLSGGATSFLIPNRRFAQMLIRR